MGMIKPVYDPKGHSKLITSDNGNVDTRSKKERDTDGVVGLTGALHYGPVGKKIHSTQQEDFSGKRSRDTVDRVGFLTQNERIEILLKAGKINSAAKAEYFDTTAPEPIYVPSVGLSLRGTKPDMAEAQAIDRANRNEIERIISDSRLDLKKQLALVRMGILEPSDVNPEAVQKYNEARKPINTGSGAEIDKIVDATPPATPSE